MAAPLDYTDPLVGGEGNEDSWHLNKSVPVALIAALILQFGGLLVTGAVALTKVENRVSGNTDAIVSLAEKVDEGALWIGAATNDKVSLAEVLTRLDLTLQTFNGQLTETRATQKEFQGSIAEITTDIAIIKTKLESMD